MNIEIPELSLVALIGASSSGKSTFAARHFAATEIVSSDQCRALVSDDENSLDASADAFDLLHYLVGKRLKRGRLTVVDATSAKETARRRIISNAREHNVRPVAIVLDLPLRVLKSRHAAREDRSFPSSVLQRHRSSIPKGEAKLRREGFRDVWILRTERDVEDVLIGRKPLAVRQEQERGPFDVIGDVHGCFDELCALLTKLSWTVARSPSGWDATPPEGRRAIFVGDLVDRGPKTPEVLELAMNMVAAGNALIVRGNHEDKLLRALRGKKVKTTHGLEESLEQLDLRTEEFRGRVRDFIASMQHHLVVDGGRLVIAHAGIKESYQGRMSGRVQSFCFYGDTNGKSDEHGLPIRLDWAKDYRGRAAVVYGHTPISEAEWRNNTLCIDTGCVFGGDLTALRYPEREIVGVPGKKYAEPGRPLAPKVKRPHTEVRADDVVGDRFVPTRYLPTIRLDAAQNAAALEAMSRFGIDPRWLIYLPPTMSPPRTHAAGSAVLEHPEEALEYFEQCGVQQLVAEEKHMGSRALALVCRDVATAERRFEVSGEQGAVWSRTGRAFFPDAGLGRAFIERVAAAIERAGLWEELDSDWVLLDAELMPWSFKAQGLIKSQYASVGAAGRSSVGAALAAAEAALAGGRGDAELVERLRDRVRSLDRFTDAYAHYVWPSVGLDDLKFAPFHVLASEGRVHSDQDHLWHMRTLAKLAEADPAMCVATEHRLVDLTVDGAKAELVAWWEALTAQGGEGLVIKPRSFVARSTNNRLVQPAIKCRGPEYLRIIYGPEYLEPSNLERLRRRGVKRKRSMAAKEFALGLEGLHRFVAGEPLRRVHPCVLGVLALESETVDPRL